MSGLAKTAVSAEEGGNPCRKRILPTNEQCNNKRSKSDEMSANEKKSNFSMLAPNTNGTITTMMNKPGATAKKLVIKNFKSMFTLWLSSCHCYNLNVGEV